MKTAGTDNGLPVVCSEVKLSNLEDVEESPKIEWELMAPHVNLKQAANLNLKFVKTHLKRQ